MEPSVGLVTHPVWSRHEARPVGDPHYLAGVRPPLTLISLRLTSLSGGLAIASMRVVAIATGVDDVRVA